MSITKKVSASPKIGMILLFLISIILFVFTGCDNALLQSPVQSDNDAEPTNDEFVNGFNNTYMEANNLSKTDIVNMMIARDKEGTGAAATRAIDASSSDLFDIFTNLSDYFTFYIEENRDVNFKLTSVSAKIGVNTDLLETPLYELDKRIKDTRYNKVDISRFAIEKIETQFIYLKGRIHVRSYTDLPFNGLLKIVDKEGDIKVKLELLYDESVNGVGYAYKVTDVDLDRELSDYVLIVFAVLTPGPIGEIGVIINEYSRYTVRQRVMEDGRDSFFVELKKYIDPEYFLIQAPTSSDPWIYLNFKVTSKGIDIIDTLVSMLKILPPMTFVHIQNKYVKVYPSADAFISNVTSNGVDYSNTNYGTYAQFMASSWTYQGRKGDTRSLMMFSNSSLPRNVFSARLYLFGTGHDPLSNSNACYIQRVTSSWSENTVTWNSQPSVTDNSQVSIAQTTSPEANVSLDLTTWVKKWRPLISLLGWDNYGFMLRLQSENYYARMQFASRDNSDASKRPYLLIHYAASTTTR